MTHRNSLGVKHKVSVCPSLIPFTIGTISLSGEYSHLKKKVLLARLSEITKKGFVSKQIVHRHLNETEGMYSEISKVYCAQRPMRTLAFLWAVLQERKVGRGIKRCLRFGKGGKHAHTCVPTD